MPALEYEAYAEMAERKLEEIARGRGRAPRAVRGGRRAPDRDRRAVGASVVIAASAPHRGEAFAGAREIIDALKLQAPIWKREEGEWVAGRRRRARAVR